LGSLSAPRFRSVLSHWIYRCELKGLYAKRCRLWNTVRTENSVLGIATGILDLLKSINRQLKRLKGRRRLQTLGKSDKAIKQ
jgi:hypothetical protein